MTECGFVSSHPGHPGPVAAGTQDNGVIRRIGDTIWERVPWGGDGGGVHYHPQPGREAFLVGQYTKVDWDGNGHFDPPIERPGTDFSAEAKRSLFYSGPAAAPGATPGKARLAIGSFRLWLTDDWDPLSLSSPPMAWRTLPTARDPLPLRNFDQDRLPNGTGNVISVKWLDPGVLDGTQFRNSKLLVLYERAVALVYQKNGIDRWDRKVLAWTKKKQITKNSDIPANGAPSEKMPMLGAWSEIAPHRATKTGDSDFLGSFYISATGASTVTDTGVTEFDRMDTLWWFDGKDKFYPTGLRNRGTKAPAFSVICDPEDPDIVYAGTAMGVWKGTLSTTAATPAWTWEMFSIGLPEAFVQDLSIHWNPAAPNGGLKLLRAAIQSRGVWEVDISANPASVGMTFLRVHPLDTRRILPTSLTDLTTTDERAPPPYPRCLSPDIAIVTAVPPAWVGGVPSEADIAQLTPKVNSIGPLASRIKAERLTAAAHKAFVLVHHRHTKPLAPSKVKVALLKRRLTAADGDGGGLALSAAWKAAVIDLVVDGQNATLDDSWKRASAAETSNPATNALTPATTVKQPAGPVEARMPRAAAFDLDLTGATAGQRYLVLAVLSSTADPLTAAELSGATVADVVLNCRHVAARTVYL